MEPIYVKSIDRPMPALLHELFSIMTGLFIGLLLVLDLILDLEILHSSALFIFFVINLLMIYLIRYKHRYNLGLLQCCIVYAVLQTHFFISPSAFEMIIYWMSCVPALSLFVNGTRLAFRYLAIVLFSIVFNATYSILILNFGYIDYSIINVSIIGFVFCIGIFSTLFIVNNLIYASLKQATELNQDIMKSYEELSRENENIGQVLAEKNRTILAQNDLIQNAAFINSHKLRASLCRVMSVVNLLESKGIKEKYLTSMIKGATEDMDEVIKELGRELS